MDPLNDMHDALVSIHKILQSRKQTNKHDCIESTSTNSKEKLATTSLTTNKCSANVSQNKDHQLHFQSLTEDNFYRAHLRNRNIDELPNVTIQDIRRLKSINVYTIQDLLGRFLIHDTPDEFYTFLVNTFQFTDKTASTITQLFDQWTKYNLDATTTTESQQNDYN